MFDFQDGQTKMIGSTRYVRRGGSWYPDQAAAAPTGNPRPLVSAPPPQPTPQTPDQARKDALDVQRGDVGLQRDRIGIERDRQQLERDRLEYEKSRRESGAPKFSEDQGKSASWLGRAFGANQDYESLGVGAPGPMQDYLRMNHPYIANSVAPKALGGSDPTWQRATAAQTEFINAMLRRDTGATINDKESQDAYRLYFPQPGESDPSVLKQHADARQRALEGLYGSAGPAAEKDGLADSFNKWRASTGLGAQGGQRNAGPPPVGGDGGRMDGTNPYAGPPGSGLTQGGDGTSVVKDPALAGLNAKVNAMLRGGRPMGEVAGEMRKAGIPGDEVMRILYQRTEGQPLSVAQFRKKYPNYRGDWSIRLDEKVVPLSGANKALNSVTNSGPGAAVGSYLNDMTGSHLDNLAQAAGGNGELVNLGLETGRDRHPGWSLAGDVASGASLYGAGRKIGGKLFGKIASKLPAWAPAVAGDAAMGGYVSSGSNGTDLFSPSDTLTGAAFGAGAGQLARGTINSLGRAVSPTGGRLAPLYEANPDFNPSLGQRAGGGVDRFEQANASIPFLGGAIRNTRNAAIDQAQRGAFNHALGDIGETLPQGVVKGTQAHAYMQTAFHKAYRTARAALSFAPDGDFTKDFGAILQDASLLGSDSQSSFKKMANDLGTRLNGRGGQLTGEDYSRIVTRIDTKVRAIRKNGGGDQELADILDRFSNAVDDAAARQSGPQAAEYLNAVRRGYAKSVIIENAARGGGEAGEFSGAQLDNAVKQGSASVRKRAYLRGEAPMQDYAGAMRGLGDTVPNSGTVDRLLATGGAVGAGVTHPAMLAPSALAVGANLPGIRRLMGAALAPNRTRFAPVRRGLIDRSRYGSALIPAFGFGSED